MNVWFFILLDIKLKDEKKKLPTLDRTQPACTNVIVHLKCS